MRLSGPVECSSLNVLVGSDVFFPLHLIPIQNVLVRCAQDAVELCTLKRGVPQKHLCSHSLRDEIGKANSCFQRELC